MQNSYVYRNLWTKRRLQSGFQIVRSTIIAPLELNSKMLMKSNDEYKYPRQKEFHVNPRAQHLGFMYHQPSLSDSVRVASNQLHNEKLSHKKCIDSASLRASFLYECSNKPYCRKTCCNVHM